jgi:chromosome segregation protein
VPLKQLILNGFKSFAQKTTINVSSGITAIVGPNGSGKSNIAEAVRWVMGEGSAKALRSSSMQDVIFAGSQQRGSLNHASVSLVFDNSKHELDNPAKELTITRRLLASGDNEYQINGNTVRLKDVRALFLSGGISSSSLAIISQGRVDSVLNSKPSERRQIFEEAAGILHFKEQKKQALRQLEKTNENLVRVHDLVQEVEGRVAPLAEQSSLARDYLFQKKQLASSEKTLLVMQIQAFDEHNKRLQQDLAAKKEMTARLNAQVKDSQAALAKVQAQSSEQQEKREQLDALLMNLSRQEADLNTRQQMAEQQAGFNEAKRKENAARLAQLKVAASEQQKQLAETNKQAAALQEQVASLNKEIAQLQEQTAGQREKLVQNLADKRSERLRHLEEQTQLRSDLASWQTQSKLAASHQQAEASRLQAGLSEAGQRLTAAKKQVVVIHQQLQAVQAQSRQLQADIAAGQKKLQASDRELQQANAQTARLRGQAHALAGMQERHEGYRYGVKTVLNDLAAFPGIVGAVGELISFDSRYEAALTTALGAGAQDLVAETAQSARDAIKQLKRRRGGRSSFLPLDRLHFRQLSAPTVAYLKRLPGFIGLGIDLVDYDRAIAPAIEYLLGSVVVTDTIDTATVAAERVRGAKIVTLDGDIIMPGGVMTGGSRGQSRSPLALSGQLSAVKAALAESQNKVAQLTDHKQSLNDELASLVAKERALANEANDLKQELVKQKTNEEGSQRRFDQLQKQLANYSETDADDVTAKIKDGQQRLAALSHLNEELADEIKAATAELTAFDQEQTKVSEKLRELLPKRAELTEKMNNAQRYGQELVQAQAHNADQRAALQKQVAALDENEEAEDFAEQKAALARQQESVKNALQQASSVLGKLSAQAANLQEEFTTSYERQQVAVDDEKNCQRDADRCATNLQSALAELSSKFSESYEAAAAEVEVPTDEDQRQELARQVALHKKTIAELGTVNLQAIDDYKQVKERYDFLSKQENDLLKARANLQKSMSDMDQRAGQQFKTSFEHVAASFAKLFPVVFGGGNAQLLLTDPDQLLTSGVEVLACPPGKKRQELSLLSGGERALTAITLLFAILETNPVPFCILDEVEAALDDVNVERFGRFLHRFAKNTQFIVISHRQGTIVQADQLCGVVMQEAGVSQVMSVSLQEIKKEIN